MIVKVYITDSNTQDSVYCAVIMTKSMQEFAWFICVYVCVFCVFFILHICCIIVSNMVG